MKVGRKNIKYLYMVTTHDELELPVGDEFVMFSNITKEGRAEIYDRIERII